MVIIEWLSQFLDYWAWIVLPLFYIGVAFVVVLETRNPPKALAYILLIALFPPLGIIVFFFFGRDIRKRKLFTLKGNEDRERLKNYWEQQQSAIRADEEQLEMDLGGLVEPIRMLHRRRQSILTRGNAIRLLINGEKKFPALLESLRGAEQHIHLEYYTFSDDEVGKQVADVLVERARAGVEVRVIADDVGSSDIKTIADRLVEAGAQLKFFQPVRFTSLASANYRNHRKIVIIDGRIGFVGGINIAERYWNTGKHKLFWRDTHIRLEGPAVNNLQLQFLLSWQFVGGGTFPIASPYFGMASRQADGCPVITAASGPDSQRPHALDCMVSLIHEARSHVRITNPYFLPPDSLSTAMAIAASSGIQVDLLIPGHSDSWIVHHASHSYLLPLMRAGVNIYLYKPGFVHAKTMIVDGKVATVGTVNLDERSFFINFEIMALVYDEGFCRQLEEAFEADLAESEKIDPEEWSGRPLTKRALESLCRLTTPLM